MPILSTIATIAAIGAAGVGAGTSIANSEQASSSAGTNQNIANSELANKNQIFQQLQPFFSQYLQSGSPYLNNIQSQAAGQNAQQYNNAAGNLRQTMGQSGLGYGPSGTTAAALGQLGQGEAQNSASTYLSNLLNNEQVKFQAAQGLTGLGNMMSQQNTVGATPQPVNSTIGSSVGALGNVLSTLNNGSSSGPTVGSGTLPMPPGFGSGTTMPTTQGFIT